MYNMLIGPSTLIDNEEEMAEEAQEEAQDGPIPMVQEFYNEGKKKGSIQ